MKLTVTKCRPRTHPTTPLTAGNRLYFSLKSEIKVSFSRRFESEKSIFLLFPETQSDQGLNNNNVRPPQYASNGTSDC